MELTKWACPVEAVLCCKVAADASSRDHVQHWLRHCIPHPAADTSLVRLIDQGEWYYIRYDVL